MNARIRFFEPTDDQETRDYLTRLAHIDEFWAQFKQVASQSVARCLPQLREQLQSIDSELGLEFEGEEDGVLQLRILPLGRAQLRPLCELIVERAPQRVPWCFESARSGLPLEKALDFVRQDCSLDLNAARCRLGVGRGHLLKVIVASHLFTGSDDALGQRAAEQLLELLLGDAAFEDWIGEVTTSSAPRPGPLRLIDAAEQGLPLSLSQLEEAFTAARVGILATLPEQPLHTFCERADWLLFELGEPTDELARQADLLTTTTMCPEMLKCFLSSDSFASQRFSRHGERFCYLKLGLRGATEQRVARRQQLEDALNVALVPGRLGCVVGAGVGTEFVYIHLALSQVDPAIARIKQCLQRNQVPQNCWLLFCDDEWRNEWVGLYTETPPPSPTLPA